VSRCSAVVLMLPILDVLVLLMNPFPRILASVSIVMLVVDVLTLLLLAVAIIDFLLTAGLSLDLSLQFLLSLVRVSTLKFSVV